jgi:hypothetical protein
MPPETFLPNIRVMLLTGAPLIICSLLPHTNLFDISCYPTHFNLVVHGFMLAASPPHSSTHDPKDRPKFYYPLDLDNYLIVQRPIGERRLRSC